MRQSLARLLLLCVGLGLIGCARQPEDAAFNKPKPRLVLTTPLKQSVQPVQKLSGIVRARYETPLSFQVGGRIKRRLADAGERVEKGQLLFELDSRDFDEALSVAKADLDAARASVVTAQQEFNRQSSLWQQKATSEERLNQTRLRLREAESRVDASTAKLTQSQNALEYTLLKSNAAGILLEVKGDVGQVISVGESVALLAQDGAREVEVFLADGNAPPESAFAVLSNGDLISLELRERAGSADPVSRTFKTRYRFASADAPLPLGSVIPVAMKQREKTEANFSVPLTAIDERGTGPRVWQINDGRASPIPIKVVSLTDEYANIKASIPEETRVISLGTHLLNEGMLVKEHN